MLHVIAAILSLLLLAGMFGAHMERDDTPAQPAEPIESAQDTGNIGSDA